MKIKILNKIGLHKLSGDMAVHGTLLLIFAPILLSFELAEGTTPWESIHLLNLIPLPSDCFNMALRIVHIVVAFALMVIIPWIWKTKLADSLKGCRRNITLWVIFFLELAIFIFLLWLILTISEPWYKYLGYVAVGISLMFMGAIICKGLAFKLKDSLNNRFRFLYWEIFLIVYVVSWISGFSRITPKTFASDLVFYVGFVWFLVICIVMLKPFNKSGKKTDQTK
jgi:hypothetical protein